MSDKDSISVSFSCDGIGPHYEKNKISNCVFDTKIPKIAIYAENGTGKTFFSRMFALQNKYNIGESIDVERLVSLNQNIGNFQFGIKNGTKNHTYSVALDKHKGITVSTLGVNYKYHVFNSDYVNDNIASYSYSPDGNISGYILGKDNIDTTAEKALIEEKQKSCAIIREEISKNVEATKSELSRKKISKSLTEFRAISIESLLCDFSLTSEETCESLSEQLNKLKNVPDNVPDFRIRKPDIDLSILRNVKAMLYTKYDKAHFDNEAMALIENVRMHSNFYQTGLDLYNASSEKICPFCRQSLDSSSMYYLDLYRKYFMRSEAQTIEEITQLENSLKYKKSDIDLFYENYSRLIIEFQKYKEYIPEYKDISIKELPPKSNITNFMDQIIESLKTKTTNIENTSFDIDDTITEIQSLIKTINDTYEAQYLLSDKLYINLQNTNNIRLKLSRKLCVASNVKLYEESKDSIKELSKQEEEVQQLIDLLKQKENKAKTSKKDLVIKDLKRFLDYFFHDKYQFDDETFGISFQNQSLDTKAKDVLSDGEKSIVAFCYYLASTHLLIETESDYQYLFFIFDDPISSMDFKYVYAIADIIRGLQNTFNFSSKMRFMVLTHNSEFMSILVRNKITNLNLSMIPGKIKKLKKELLMPYEYHLADINNVANGKKEPDHTIPNSIRHVIETIMRFEDPNDDSTEKYIIHNEILSKNAYIYALMQDNSHGIVRKQPAISATEIVDACQVVIQFVTDKYPKQLPSGL